MSEDIIDMLMELEIEQIEEARRKLKEKYPNDRQFIAACQMVIGMKKAQQKMNDFISMIEEIKSAPDDAGTPSQGK